MSSLFPGISPNAMAIPQPAVDSSPADVMTEITTRETKAAAAERVVRVPSMGVRDVFTTTPGASRSNLPDAGTANSPSAASSDTDLTATNPIFAMAGSESTSPFYPAPAPSAQASQPQTSAGVPIGNAQPAVATTSPQQANPSAGAGAIRPLSMAPTNSGAASALTAAVAAAAGAEQAGLAAQPSTLGGSGGGGGSNNPTIRFSGDNVVGGAGEVVLSAPSGLSLQSVTWQISGAEQSQSFVNSKGSVTDLPNPDGPLPEAGSTAQIDFFWNLQTGDHTISASVVYANNAGSGTSNTVTVNVVAPSVSSYKVTYTPLVWGTIPSTGTTGFFLTPPGMTYSATVSLPAAANTSGQFLFAQLTSWNNTDTTAKTGVHQYNTNGYVLDNPLSMPNPGDPGYPIAGMTPITVNPGGQASTQPGAPSDVPYQAYLGSGNDFARELKVNMQFVSYVVFKTQNGIWVGLGSSPALTLIGDEAWQNGAWTANGAPSPANGGTLNGNSSLQWMTWTGYRTATQWTNMPLQP